MEATGKKERWREKWGERDLDTHMSDKFLIFFRPKKKNLQIFIQQMQYRVSKVMMWFINPRWKVPCGKKQQGKVYASEWC